MANALAWVSSGINYLLSQDFESSGTPAGWTTAGTGTATFHNTVSPLEGTGDLSLVGNKAAIYTFSSTISECWFVSLVKFISLPAATSRFVDFLSVADADVIFLQITSAGQIKLFNDGGFVGNMGTLASAATLYYLKIHHKKGTGADSVTSAELSTTGTWINSGGFFVSTTTGASVVDVAKIRDISSDVGTEFRFDHVRMYGSDLGNSFSNWP